MKIEKLKVRLIRGKGAYKATVIQDTAEGEVKGANILGGRNIMLEQTAKDAVRVALGPGVEQIDFEVIDHEGQ